MAAAAGGAGGDGGGSTLWSAILITIVAAAGNNIGKALQKQATRTLPRLTLRGEVMAQYATSGTWLLGMATDLGGALLMIAAFARAPVSVVQPVSSVGLVFLMLFSHFYLKERLQPSEWVAAATAGLGVLLLGASSEPVAAPAAAAAAPGAAAPGGQAAGKPAAAGAAGGGAAAAAVAAAAGPSAARVVVSFLLLLGLMAFEVWWRQHRQHRKRRSGAPPRAHDAHAHARGGDDAADAAACGLEAGACFGFSAAACRTGFQLAPTMGWLLVPMGLAASVGLTSSGFVLQTRGLKHGKAVVVCTLAAASSMVSGVLVGLLALGEALPHGGARRLLRLLSWVLILVGVTNLSGGSDEGGGGGVMRWAEDAARAAPLPHGARLWVLAALRGLRRLVGGGDGGKGSGRGSKAGASLLANGHDEGGPSLPVVVAQGGAEERAGGGVARQII